MTQLSKTYVYPVVISYDKDETSAYKYLAYIPDLDGYTQGKTLAEAIAMARDYIGTFSLGNNLPDLNSVKFDKEEGDIVTLVDLNPSDYKASIDLTPVKKTLTIPTYVNEAGIKAGLNFSQTLTDAIKNKLALK